MCSCEHGWHLTATSSEMIFSQIKQFGNGAYYAGHLFEILAKKLISLHTV